MSPELIAVLILVSLFLVVFVGYPVAFGLAGVAMAFGLIFVGPQQASTLFINRTFGLMSSYILLAAPLFIFMGSLLEHSGITERLFDALYRWLGALRGGLAVSVVLIGTIFAACVGVIGASVVTMGIVALPAMLRRGYQKPLATGSVMAGGVLGILIPPSIMIVFYAPMANISMGRLLMAAFVPGLVLSGLYIAYIVTRCYLQPEIAPALPPEERRMTFRQRAELLPALVPPLFLMVAVLGSIFFGLATPTEAAAMGAGAALVLVIVNRKLTLAMLKGSVYATLRATSMVLMIAIGATMVVGIFTRLGGGDVVRDLLLAAPFGKWGVLGITLFVVFLLGYFIDWIGIIFLIVPLVTPVARQVGFDPVWFSMVIIVMLQTSFLTPPFAYAIFYLKGVAPPEVTMGDLYRGVVPFIALQLLAVLAVILFPQLVLWLPSLMYD